MSEVQDKKWADGRVQVAVKLFLDHKQKNRKVSYEEIANNLGDFFPEYQFTSEAVRGYWRRNRAMLTGKFSKDGRTDLPGLREIKKWTFEQDLVEIVCLYDIHGLDDHAHYDLFLDKLDYIAENDNVYAIIGGDLINFATRTSLSSPYTSASPGDEIKQTVKDLKKIAPKLLGAVKGNHDGDRGLRGDGIDPIEVIMSKLELEDIYFSNLGILNLKLPDVNYHLVFAHGARGGAARKKAGQLASLEDLMDIYPNGDIFCTSHTHAQGFYRTASREINKIEDSINVRYHTCVSCGSYCGYESSYAEAKLYSPQPVGLAHIILPNKLDVDGSKIIDVVFRV